MKKRVAELEERVQKEQEHTQAQKQHAQAALSKLKLVEQRNKKLREDFELMKSELDQKDLPSPKISKSKEPSLLSYPRSRTFSPKKGEPSASPQSQPVQEVQK